MDAKAQDLLGYGINQTLDGSKSEENGKSLHRTTILLSKSPKNIQTANFFSVRHQMQVKLDGFETLRNSESPTFQLEFL